MHISSTKTHGVRSRWVLNSEPLHPRPAGKGPATRPGASPNQEQRFGCSVLETHHWLVDTQSEHGLGVSGYPGGQVENSGPISGHGHWQLTGKETHSSCTARSLHPQHLCGRDTASSLQMDFSSCHTKHSSSIDNAPRLKLKGRH